MSLTYVNDETFTVPRILNSNPIHFTFSKYIYGNLNMNKNHYITSGVASPSSELINMKYTQLNGKKSFLDKYLEIFFFFLFFSPAQN